MNWKARLKRLGKALDAHPRSGPQANLPLEIMAYLGYCEELISAVGLNCIKQIVTRVLLQPIFKMFALLIGTIATLIYYSFWFSTSPVFIRIAIPTFFATATILVCYEAAWCFYRHINESTEFPGESEE